MDYIIGNSRVNEKEQLSEIGTEDAAVSCKAFSKQVPKILKLNHHCTKWYQSDTKLPIFNHKQGQTF